MTTPSISSITLLLVLLNAFFVAAEFAIVKIRPTRLEQLVRTGDARARLALDISHHLDAYLSTTQLGVTLASLGLGWIGEPSIARVVEPLFAALGPWAVPGAHVVGVVVAFVAITALHTIVGELAPKSFAIQRTEEMTLWAGAARWWISYHMAWPIIRTPQRAGANRFVKIFGIALREEGGDPPHLGRSCACSSPRSPRRPRSRARAACWCASSICAGARRATWRRCAATWPVDARPA